LGRQGYLDDLDDFSGLAECGQGWVPQTVTVRLDDGRAGGYEWAGPPPPADGRLKRMDRPDFRIGPGAGPSYVSTAQVAEALGVSVTTVKRWVDDGILPAYRTPGGHRKLLAADVKRLAREGHLPQSDLSRLDPRVADPGPAALTATLETALTAGNGAAVRAAIRDAYRQAGLPVEAIADQVIAPAMARLGHGWESGAIDVLHEHRGTQLCKAALYELKAELEVNAERGRPVAVGGAPEGDHYTLPSLLAQMALLDVGWDAVNVGPNTPAASFRRALTELRPRLLWVSVSYLADPERFIGEFRELYRAALAAGVAVAVGGSALRDEVRQRIPYTTHGDGLTHLVAFARTLHPRPRRPRRGRPPAAR
jgi:excisionase family DNA binding protein